LPQSGGGSPRRVPVCVYERISELAAVQIKAISCVVVFLGRINLCLISSHNTEFFFSIVCVTVFLS